MNKKKLLLFVKIPPPITGATIINQSVIHSKILKNTFDIRKICVSYSKSVSNLGIISFNKIFIFIYTLTKLLIEIIFYRPKVIYFQISPLKTAFIRDLVYVIFMKLFRINKIVFHIHGKGIKDETKIKWKRFLYQFVFSGSYVISLSDLLIDDIKPLSVKQIFVVNNGIPQLSFPIKKNNTPYIKLLYLSNLIIEKGILDFIQSIILLKQSGINFKAFIVGAEGNLSIDNLTTLLDTNNLIDSTKYLGPLYGNDKWTILSESDILVFPTKMKHECFPTVILEAFQFGVPVISTDEGAIPDIIDNEINGIIINKNSPIEITNKIIYLYNFPDKRIQMGINAHQKFIEKYTIEIFEKNMVNVFNNVLNNLSATK
jgi:glycosyltransferase involved in cell wall biosynthesis